MLEAAVKRVLPELMTEHVQDPATFGVGIAIEFAGILEIVADDGLAEKIGLSEPAARTLPALVVGLILAVMRFHPKVFHKRGEAFV